MGVLFKPATFHVLMEGVRHGAWPDRPEISEKPPLPFLQFIKLSLNHLLHMLDQMSWLNDPAGSVFNQIR